MTGNKDPLCHPFITILPPPFLAATILCSISKVLFQKMLYKRNHIACVFSVFAFLSAQFPEDPSKLLCASIIHPFLSFLLVSSNPWYVVTRVYLTIHLWKDIWVVSSLGLLQIRLLWTFVTRFYVNIMWFFYPVTASSGHTVDPQSMLLGD